METRHYWEENRHAVSSVKYENYISNDGFGRKSEETLFAPPSEDEAEYPPGAYLKKGKVSRQDPMSHRIIEKRRRDRMNNCLADLSRLIPPEYLKKGRGRVEKTEIIEMAIRHLKYLQERVNGLYHGSKGTAQYVAERQVGQEFRAGYQQAVSEALRFLVEVHGFGPSEGLCASLASHLQRHCEHIVKGETILRDKPMSHPGSSSDVGSSSSSSLSYQVKPGLIRRPEPPADPTPILPCPAEPYDEKPPDLNAMECDRVGQTSLTTESEPAPDSEPLPLNVRKRDPTLRTMRKREPCDEYLHSYKFKNSIERRFSRSQDCEAADMSIRSPHPHPKPYSHKRRRAAKPPISTSTSASGSTGDARDTSPQETCSESPHHHYDDPSSSKIPVFALNALGKYYVPLYVDYACLTRYLGPYDVLNARGAHVAAPLHPVSIHVHFQPCFNIHNRQEPYRESGPVL